MKLPRNAWNCADLIFLSVTNLEESKMLDEAQVLDSVGIQIEFLDAMTHFFKKRRLKFVELIFDHTFVNFDDLFGILYCFFYILHVLH